MSFLSGIKSLFSTAPSRSNDHIPDVCLITNIKPEYYLYIDRGQLLEQRPKDLSNFKVIYMPQKDASEDDLAEKYFLPKDCKWRKREEIDDKLMSHFVRIKVTFKTYLTAISDKEIAKRLDKQMIAYHVSTGEIPRERLPQINIAIQERKQHRADKKQQKKISFREKTAGQNFSTLLANFDIPQLMKCYSIDELKDKFDREFDGKPIADALPLLPWPLFALPDGREIIGFEKRFNEKGSFSYKIPNGLVTYTFDANKIRYKALDSNGKLFGVSTINLSNIF